MQDSPPRPSPDHKKTKLEPGDAFSFDFDGSGVIGFPGFAEKWIPSAVEMMCSLESHFTPSQVPPPHIGPMLPRG